MGNLLVTRAGGNKLPPEKRRGKKKKKRAQSPRGMEERQRSARCSNQLGEPFLSVNTLNRVWRNDSQRALMCLSVHFRQQWEGRVKGEFNFKNTKGSLYCCSFPHTWNNWKSFSLPLPQAFSQSFPAQAKLPSIFITSLAPALNLLWGY